jgi:hypothetical protein
MQPPQTYRCTIGQFMAGIAVLAGLLAVPCLVNSPDRLVFVCAFGILATFVLINGLIEILIAGRCPACSRRALRRLRRDHHYYCCTECRARFKRFGSGPWLDASGPDDAALYARPTGFGSWDGFAAPKKLDGSTGGLLLQGRRSRDLPGEVRRRPHQPGAKRPREAAERKVRRFLVHLREIKGARDGDILESPVPGPKNEPT